MFNKKATKTTFFECTQKPNWTLLSINKESTCTGGKIFTIAIASGKGGVGKSSVAVNLSLALTLKKQKVILFDGDMGLGNVTFMLGLKGVTANLSHVITGEKQLNEIIVKDPNGLMVIPAASGVDKLANLDAGESRKLWLQFQEIEAYGDFLVLDLGAGISETVLNFLLASDAMMVLTTPGKTAVLDAYALIKVLHQRNPNRELQLFINQYKDDAERGEIFNKLQTVAQKFLGITLLEVGGMKKSWHVDKALNTQAPFVINNSKSAAAKSMYDLADYYISQSHQVSQSKSRIKMLSQS